MHCQPPAIQACPRPRPLQASRLGVTCTKGAFDGGWPLHESLLEVFLERVVRLKELAAAATGTPVADVHLPLYIMTSSANDGATRAFLEHNRFFGLPGSDVFVFSQGSLPAFGMDGRFLLKTSSEVMTAPDGNGGLFPALHTSGALADMRRRGVASVQVSTVDNILARVCDPIFTGACLAAGALVGSKVVRKTDPGEKVGCLAIARGKYCPIEYSELPPALAAQRDDATGRLRFDAGNVCIHWYSVAWLDSVAPGRWTPVYHGARKAIAHVDPATGDEVPGDVTKPEGSGWKLESFMFDAFPDRVPLGTMLTLEVAREAEFAPIKNASGAGADDPRTARALLSALHRQWLEAAGATVLGSGRVEVSPLVSYEGEGLEQLAGMTLHAPLVIMPGTRLVKAVVPSASPAAGVAGAVSSVTPSGVAAETSLELDAAGDVVHHYRVSTQVEIHKIVPTVGVGVGGTADAGGAATGGATAAAGGAA